VPRYRQALAAYLDMLVRVAFNETAITESVQRYCSLIARSVRGGDPAYAPEDGMHSVGAFDNGCQNFIQLTRDRSQFIQDSLQNSPESYLWTPGTNQ